MDIKMEELPTVTTVSAALEFPDTAQHDLAQQSQEFKIEDSPKEAPLNDMAEQSQEHPVVQDSHVPPTTTSVLQFADSPTDTFHLGEGINLKTETPTTPTAKRRCLRPRQVCISSSNSSSNDTDDSEYFPTPIRRTMLGQTPLTSLPNNCFLAQFQQLDSFIRKESRGCERKHCLGKIAPAEVVTEKLGGAAKIVYVCKKCSSYSLFESCSNQSNIGMATQVAFITAGCTHATYKKVLNILGMTASSFESFGSTIRKMHPVVEEMVTEMCNREKDRMKAMDQTKLGSWSRAITCADGTWQTRGYHSKNGTFTIRNYETGALLYFTHMCQKGRDKVITSELYKGTSKSMEGYGANQLLKIAKEEGINIEVHWQDADSSASKHVTEHYPDAKVMICGVHAGRAHLKQLQDQAKCRKFEETMQKKHKGNFPEISSADCHCKRRVVSKQLAAKDKFKYIPCKKGCGCLTDTFCHKSRNNFSNILSTSQSAAEFRARLRGLVHHVQDEHQWEEVWRCDEHDLTVCKECKLENVEMKTRKCDFHPLTVCDCGKCVDSENHKCVGKEYHTREVLTCPFHLLAYKIDCDRRIKMANQLVHETLKHGHTNWLESSHNVFIRFRPKHIYLERLHYHVSTNLGLLQANMTNEHEQQGPAYHWKTELYKKTASPNL